MTFTKDMTRAWAVILSILMMFCMVSFFTTPAYADSIFDMVGEDGSVTVSDTGETATKSILDKYRTVATALTGVLTITMFIFSLLQFTKLGAAGDNAQDRKRAIMGIITTLIATALLGSATVIIGWAYKFLF